MVILAGCNPDTFSNKIDMGMTMEDVKSVAGADPDRIYDSYMSAEDSGKDYEAVTYHNPLTYKSNTDVLKKELRDPKKSIHWEYHFYNAVAQTTYIVTITFDHYHRVSKVDTASKGSILSHIVPHPNKKKESDKRDKLFRERWKNDF